MFTSTTESPAEVDAKHIAIVLDVCPAVEIQITVGHGACTCRPSFRCERIIPRCTYRQALVCIVQLDIAVVLAIVYIHTGHRLGADAGSCHQRELAEAGTQASASFPSAVLVVIAIAYRLVPMHTTINAQVQYIRNYLPSQGQTGSHSFAGSPN